MGDPTVVDDEHVAGVGDRDGLCGPVNGSGLCPLRRSRGDDPDLPTDSDADADAQKVAPRGSHRRSTENDRFRLSSSRIRDSVPRNVRHNDLSAGVFGESRGIRPSALAACRLIEGVGQVAELGELE